MNANFAVGTSQTGYILNPTVVSLVLEWADQHDLPEAAADEIWARIADDEESSAAVQPDRV